MDTSATPTCPECGFRIYNCRFPKCESCGARLSETLVYSPVERFMLQLEDEQRSLATARLSRAEAFAMTTPRSFDDGVLSAVMSLTEH